jgi:hypothetical protein
VFQKPMWLVKKLFEQMSLEAMLYRHKKEKKAELVFFWCHAAAADLRSADGSNTFARKPIGRQTFGRQT